MRSRRRFRVRNNVFLDISGKMAAAEQVDPTSSRVSQHAQHKSSLRPAPLERNNAPRKPGISRYSELRLITQEDKPTKQPKVSRKSSIRSLLCALRSSAVISLTSGPSSLLSPSIFSALRNTSLGPRASAIGLMSFSLRSSLGFASSGGPWRCKSKKRFRTRLQIFDLNELDSTGEGWTSS